MRDGWWGCHTQYLPFEISREHLSGLLKMQKKNRELDYLVLINLSGLKFETGSYFPKS